MTSRHSLYAQSFSQILKWNGDPNVLEYKVEIKNNSGTTIKTVTTESSSVNLSLSPGKYRYKITAYDLLGREAVSTKWTDFEVLRANQPAIEHKQSLESLQEDGKTLELDLNVTDVTSDTIAELVNQKTGKKIRGKLILSGVSAAAGSSAGAAGAATFAGSETYKASKVSFENVPEGNWKLVITNPSGLSTESESFEVKDIYKEKKAAAEKAEKERLAREKKEREEAERLAKEKAEREEAERIAREEAERIERERIAAIEAARAEEERKQRAELQKILEQVEKEKQAKLEEEKKAREEMIQQMVIKEEEKRIEEEKITRIEEEKRAIEEAAREEERLAREEERLAREEEEKAAEAERLAREEKEKLARKEAEESEKEEAKKRRREKWLTYDRKFNLTVGAGIALSVINNDFNELYVNNSSLNPTLNAKIGFLPLHSKNGRVRFGMELAGMATRFQNQNEYYNLNFDMLTMQDNLSLRFGNKKKKMWLQLNGGGGLVIMKETLDYSENTENNKKDKTLYYGYFTAGGGLSIIFTPSSTFRMELGVDYYNLFIPEMNLGLVNPYLGIGIRL